MFPASQDDRHNCLENGNSGAVDAEQDTFRVIHRLSEILDGALPLFSRADMPMADAPDDLFPRCSDQPDGHRIGIHNGVRFVIDNQDSGWQRVQNDLQSALAYFKFHGPAGDPSLERTRPEK